MHKILFGFCLIGTVFTGQSLSLNDLNQPLPVVMWHGMGNSIFCTGNYRENWVVYIQFFSGDTASGLKSFGNFLINVLGPNAYIKSIQIGRNTIDDFRSGYFVHPNKQIEAVCSQIASDPKLQNGYNALGFSQAGQFL